jgi:hypothetical protein
MADLNFVKNENTQKYVAEAVVNSNFNIHLERISGGGLNLFQKNGEYTEAIDDRTATERGFDTVPVPNTVPYNSGLVFDYDFDALVYPKVIRIESYTEVTSGILTEAE